MASVKVLGHLTPDTDSTCSAIVYAWYLSTYKKTEAIPYILGDLNNETAFVLKHFGENTPEKLEELHEGDAVVVVDTNNPAELPSSFAQASLLEIIDHHKLVGGIATASPVTVTLRPVACTTTILWQIMEQENHTNIPQNTAGLMLAAILSDTLNFTSPTVTDADKHAAEALALLAKEDPTALAHAMFEAKSDLSGMSAHDILLMDGKIFTLNGKKIRISSLETTKPGNAMSMHAELVAEMETIKKEEALDGFFFFIVDILTTSAQLIVSSSFERVVAEKGFENAHFDSDVMQLPGVVSRKKQMVPAIEKGIAG
jgi:manganese-dependent inorganic pyrophosphatase